MRPVHDIRWLSEPPRPGRQYAFGRRGDRRRMAQRLAAGWGVEQVALVERAHAGALRELLRDDGFERLVAHYQELLAEDADQRLARLAELALELLTTALEAGDVRVALFFINERLRGRRPDQTVAEALARGLERATSVSATPAPARAAPTRTPTPPAPPRREADFAWCAATQPSPEAAEALAVEQAQKLESGLEATLATLRRQLLNEAERAGTVTARPGAPAELELAQAGASFARSAHFTGGRAITAATRLEAWRRSGGAAPPTPSPPSHAIRDRMGTPISGRERAGVRGSAQPASASRASAAAREATPSAPPHPHPLPPAGEGNEAAGASPPATPPPAPPTPASPYPAWLHTVPHDHLAYAVRLPAHELDPYLRRVAAMYSIPWEPPDSG